MMTFIYVMVGVVGISLLIDLLAFIARVILVMGGEARIGRYGVKFPGISLGGDFKFDRFSQGLKLRRFMIDQIKRHLIDKINRDVVIHAPSGKSCAPIDDGAFHIHLYASPDARALRKVPHLRFGSRRMIAGCGFAGNCSNTVAVDDLRFEILEYVKPNNLYVLVSVGETFEEINPDLCAVLFERAAEILEAKPGRRVQVAGDDASRASTRHAFIDGCTDRTIDQKVGRLQTEQQSRLDLIASARKKLSSKRRELMDSEEEAAMFSTVLETQDQAYDREIQSVLKLPKVKSVSVVGDTLQVFTERLTCAHPVSGKQHVIGAFRIDVMLDGSDGGVRWNNLTQTVDAAFPNMQAPYVFSDGKALMGQTQGLFPTLIGEKQLARVVRLAIRFIEQANPADVAAQYVDCWPVLETT